MSERLAFEVPGLVSRRRHNTIVYPPARFVHRKAALPSNLRPTAEARGHLRGTRFLFVLVFTGHNFRFRATSGQFTTQAARFYRLSRRHSHHQIPTLQARSIQACPRTTRAACAVERILIPTMGVHSGTTDYCPLKACGFVSYFRS